MSQNARLAQQTRTPPTAGSAAVAIVAGRQIWSGQFVAAEGRLALAGTSLLRSDERVEHDLPDLLSAAASDGELSGPLQCLFA